MKLIPKVTVLFQPSGALSNIQTGMVVYINPVHVILVSETRDGFVYVMMSNFGTTVMVSPTDGELIKQSIEEWMNKP